MKRLKTKLLSMQEEQALINKAQAGDVEAAQQIVMAFLPLVLAIISRMPPSTCKEDQINNGVLGIYRALEKFDPERNVRFSTYAKPWIWALVQEAEKAAVPTDRAVPAKTYVYSQLWGFAAKQGHVVSTPKPGTELTVNELELLEEEADEIFEAASYDAEMKVFMHEALEEIVPTLSDREQKALRRIITSYTSQRGLGAELGLSKQRVFQIERELLRKLKEAILAKIDANQTQRQQGRTGV